MKHTAIIADDLTGANDTGVQFCQQGFSTLVIIDPGSVGLVGQDKDVWAINTDTRSLTSAEAYQRVFDVTEKIKNRPTNHIYKKIDSTLRGHPGVELEAVMDAWQADLGLVVPAFPANSRIVREGYLIVGEGAQAGIDGTEDSVNFCHVPSLFQNSMRRQVGNIALKEVRRGEDALLIALEAAQKENQVLTLDAVTEEDLQIIARAIARLPGNVIVAGAAGLAAHLALVWKSKEFSETPLIENGTMLFIVGTRNPVTAAQVRQLLNYSGCRAVQVNTGAIAAGNIDAEIKRVLKEASSQATKDRILIIIVDSLFQQSHESDDFRASGKAIATVLGIITSCLMGVVHAKGLVVSGGDTAVHICRALGVKGITLVAEILPGIPLGYLEDGMFKKMQIVTKAGGFGSSGSLIEVMQYLDQETNNPMNGVY